MEPPKLTHFPLGTRSRRHRGCVAGSSRRNLLPHPLRRKMRVFVETPLHRMRGLAAVLARSARFPFSRHGAVDRFIAPSSVRGAIQFIVPHLPQRRKL